MATPLDLIQKRAALNNAANAIAAAMQDIQSAGREGSEAAGYAACWAAVMMATGIVKTGLTVSNKGAAAGFAAIDGAIANANKVLGALGMRTIATKGEAMKSLDPNLAGAAGFLRDVGEARRILKQAGANPPAHLKLLLDLATQMAEDTLLMLQAGQTQGDVHRNTRAAHHQAAARLHALRTKIMLLDNQISMLLAQRDVMQRTA